MTSFFPTRHLVETHEKPISNYIDRRIYRTIGTAFVQTIIITIII